MAEQAALTRDDVLMPWQGASGPDLSADGKRIVYACDGYLWWAKATGGEARRLTRGRSARWSPTTSEIAFLRDSPTQVWLRDRNGNERPLARSLGGSTGFGLPIPDFSWSPDGRKIATIAPSERSAAGDSETPPATIVEVHRRCLAAGQALWVTDVQTGEARRVTQTAPGVSWFFSPAWSPDGERLALVEDVFEVTGGEEETRLSVVDVETGGASYPIGRSMRRILRPEWSPDGSRLAFPYGYNPENRLAPTRKVCGVIDASGGEVELLAADYVVSSVCWHPDGRTLCCLGNHGNTTQVLRVDTLTGAVQPLTRSPGVHANLRVSADGEWLVCTYVTPRTLAEVYLLSIDGCESRPLTEVSRRLGCFRLADTELVHWPARDGLEIEGVLIKPLDYRRGWRYPAIVDVHGGPGGGVWLGFHPEWHWLAGHGYLVLAPDYRASQQYGWCDNPDPAVSADDIIAGVDWLVAEGYADPGRVGLRGFSHGAMLTAWAIGRTARFRAAVVEGVRCHLEVSYGTGWGPGGNAMLASALGGRPWEIPDVYRANSPLTYLHRARTPTLILQGERDMLVEAELLYTWLRQAGVEVEFVKYIDESHVIQKPEHRADGWRRTLAWFDRHLKSG